MKMAWFHWFGFRWLVVELNLVLNKFLFEDFVGKVGGLCYLTNLCTRDFVDRVNFN